MLKARPPSLFHYENKTHTHPNETPTRQTNLTRRAPGETSRKLSKIDEQKIHSRLFIILYLLNGKGFCTLSRWRLRVNKY